MINVELCVVQEVGHALSCYILTTLQFQLINFHWLLFGLMIFMHFCFVTLIFLCITGSSSTVFCVQDFWKINAWHLLFSCGRV
jgi:hypothetical protein